MINQILLIQHQDNIKKIDAAVKLAETFQDRKAWLNLDCGRRLCTVEELQLLREYEEAGIRALSSMDESWVTINGRHVMIGADSGHEKGEVPSFGGHTPHDDGGPKNGKSTRRGAYHKDSYAWLESKQKASKSEPHPVPSFGGH